MERILSTAPVSTRKRRGEGHTRRDEILMAAKELFLREGYQATTIRRIAARYLAVDKTYRPDRQAVQHRFHQESRGCPARTQPERRSL